MPTTAGAVADAINNGYDVLYNTPEPTTPISEPVVPPLPHAEEITEPFAAAHAAFLEAVARLTTAVPTGNVEEAVAALNEAYKSRSLVNYESSRESSAATTQQPPLEEDKEECEEAEEERAESPEYDRAMEPSIVSVLDGGDLVGWTVAATALSLMNDEEFKKTILERNNYDSSGQPTNPCLISVYDGYQKLYVTERVKVLFPVNTPKIIYVCSTMMMKDPPTHWDQKLNFREFNIQPPNEFEMRTLVDPVLDNYGVQEDPKVFDRVFMLITLMSNFGSRCKTTLLRYVLPLHSNIDQLYAHEPFLHL
jgi:hypothetical protein